MFWALPFISLCMHTIHKQIVWCIQSLDKSVEIMCLLKDNTLKVTIKKKKWLCYFCNKDYIIHWTPVVVIC